MADPLSILGGVAASIQLVECATGTLVGSIKLIRDLREIPRKIANCLEDVERSSERLNHISRDILRPEFLSVNDIEPKILDRLSPSCDGLRFAIDDAEAVIRPLVEGFDSRKHSATYRLWNTVVSKTRESAVLEKLYRLHRLSLELIGDFNMVNLTVQLELRSESSKGLNSLVKSGTESQSTLVSIQRDVNSGFESLRDSHETTMGRAQTMINKTDNLTSDVVSLAETTDSIHQHTANIRSEMQAHFRLNHDDMERMMQYHEKRMSTELKSLRDELILVISATESSSSTKSAELGLGQLAKQDEALLQSGTALSLIQQPDLLRDAWKMSNRTASSFETCSCRHRTKTRSRKIWNIQFSSFRREDHRIDCPFRLSGSHSWSHSLSANLRPFLNRVVEISLGAATGPGTWTLFPPLMICRIVQRSKSPVFSAFDRTLDLCTRRKAHGYMNALRRRYTWTDNNSQGEHSAFELEWLPSTGEELRDLNMCIQSEIRKGKFSGIESDENGFTILFEFCNLLTLMGWQWRRFEHQLSNLLKTILQSQVNVQATTAFNESLRHYGIANIFSDLWNYKQVTSAEYLVGRGFTDLVASGPEIPFYDELLQGGVIDGLWSASSSNGGNSGLGSMPPRLLIHHVEIAEALDYDDLACAIAKRSIEGVNFLASKAVSGGVIEESWQRRVTYMELALGWPAGIQYLLSKGFSVGPAIRSACHSRDLDSLSLLLTSNESIFSISLDPLWFSTTGSPLWAVREAIDSGCVEVLKLVLLEMQKRRRLLCDDVPKNCPEDEMRRVNMTEMSILTGKYGPMFAKWRDGWCTLPETENQSEVSPYHFVIRHQDFHDRTSSLGGYADILDAIYSCGFTNVDDVDKMKETPMFRHVRRAFRETALFNRAFHEGDIVEWFLARGASVANNTGEGWPNILFYLAFCGSVNLRSWETYEWEGKQAQTISESLQVSRDTCKCFCSSFGCLPIHLVLRCYKTCERGCVHAISRAKLLQCWTRRWNISADVRETLTMEMIRLELFERLGMAHTCCRHTCRAYSPFLVESLPDSEIRFIQDDDSELNAQLEAILVHYELWKLEAQNMSGPLEEVWWKAVDEILPPLIPYECHQRHWAPVTHTVLVKDPETSRGEREKEALRQCGFEDFSDFKEVIDIHLSERKVKMLKAPNIKQRTRQTEMTQAKDKIL